MALRIIVIEDHGITRQGLCFLLDKESNIEVIAEAVDGREGLELVRKLQPDIVITDISMPNLNGVDATRQIIQEFPNIKVIALSMHARRPFVADMLKAGASAYLLKECLMDELIEAIHTVAAGGTYLSAKVSGVVVSDYVHRLSGVIKSPLESLTTREREVLQLIGEGKNTKEIALILHVGTKAIEANRRKIMEKLDAHSVADLVKIAIAGGLIFIET